MNNYYFLFFLKKIKLMDKLKKRVEKLKNKILLLDEESLVKLEQLTTDMLSSKSNNDNSNDNSHDDPKNNSNDDPTFKNVWKPSFNKDKIHIIQNNEHLTIKELRSLLNKITLESYDRISELILGLDIENKDVLVKSCNIIFEKAVLEPTFCSMYANLIKRMSSKYVNDNNGKKYTFKSEFLNICQKEFKEQQINPSKDSEFNEEQQWKYNQRIKGTIHLVKALYQVKIIPVKIVRKHCLDKLLSESQENPSSHAPESLCKLINDLQQNIQDCKLVGSDADNYIDTLNSIKNKVKKFHGMRVVFMIEDSVNILSKYSNVSGKKENKKNIHPQQKYKPPQTRIIKSKNRKISVTRRDNNSGRNSRSGRKRNNWCKGDRSKWNNNNNNF